MISQKFIETIRKAIKFKHDEHVSKLRSITDTHLKKIVPNRGIPVTSILGSFNTDTGIELNRYGDEIKAEILRVIETLKLSEFTEGDKKVILHIVDEFCNAQLYLKRFEVILPAIERKTSSYGIKIDLAKYRIDIPKSICESSALNTTHRIRSKIENELDCIIESFNSKSNGTENKISGLSKWIELKPNFFGVGLNINAIIDKFFKRKKI